MKTQLYHNPLPRAFDPGQPAPLKGFGPATQSVKKIILTFVLAGAFFAGYAQTGTCKDCSIPSFGAITVYQVLQPGSLVGFGFEGGTWNKKSTSRFSVFLGAKMQWFNQTPNPSKEDNSGEKTRFAVYAKGQFEVLKRFYIELSPELVNLSSFDAAVGLRYVIPVTRYLALGLEPSYLVVDKQYVVNLNVHFAL